MAKAKEAKALFQQYGLETGQSQLANVSVPSAAYDLVIIFKYIPMYGAQIAFRDYTIQGGFTGSEWVGLKHFKRFFTSYSFRTTLRTP